MLHSLLHNITQSVQHIVTQYTVLHNVTMYMVLHSVKQCNTVLHSVTLCYRVLQYYTVYSLHSIQYYSVTQYTVLQSDTVLHRIQCYTVYSVTE